MAWWGQPEGSVTPIVTLKWLAAWLIVHGHHYNLDLPEGAVHFSVAGLDYVLMVIDRQILVVRAHHRPATTRPSFAEFSRIHAVTQEVSNGRLIPVLYTEIDAVGLSLCVKVLTNIGVGLDDAQRVSALDFILDGVDQTLREVPGPLAAQGVAADSRPDVGPEARSAPQAGNEPETVGKIVTEGEGDGATVIALPEVPRSDRATGTIGTADTAEIAGGESTRDSVQILVAATMRSAAAGTAAGRTDATVEMAAVVDGPASVTPGNAEGETGTKTTGTPKSLLVSQRTSVLQTRSGDIRWKYWSGGSQRRGAWSWSWPGRVVVPDLDTPRGRAVAGRCSSRFYNCSVALDVRQPPSGQKEPEMPVPSFTGERRGTTPHLRCP